MDFAVVIKKHFTTKADGPIMVFQCNTCKKPIIQRAGSTAITRLISHINQHGALNLDTSK